MQHTCRKLDSKALLFLLSSNYQMAKQFQSVTAFDFDVKTNPSQCQDCAFVWTLRLNHPPGNITGSMYSSPYMSTGVESIKSTLGAKKSPQNVH